MANAFVRFVRSVWKHGLRAPELYGITDIGGQLLGTKLSGANVEANEYSAQQAQEQRDWEERMSNTAMQRSVADYKAAGINPVLAAGNPASTPSASAPQSTSPSSSPFASLLSEIPSLMLQQKSLDIQNALGNRNARLRGIELGLEKQRIDNDYDIKLRELGVRGRHVDKIIEEIDANIARLAQETDNVEKQNALLDVQKRIAEADESIKKAFADRVGDIYDAEIALTNARTESEKARASRDYSEALAIQFKQSVDERIYTDDYIDSVIEKAVLDNQLRNLDVDASVLRNYVLWCKDAIMSGIRPGSYTITLKGKKPFTLNAWDVGSYQSARKGLGLDGPSTVSSSWSHSDEPFGVKRSRSGSSTESYNSSF